MADEATVFSILAAHKSEAEAGGKLQDTDGALTKLLGGQGAVDLPSIAAGATGSQTLSVPSFVSSGDPVIVMFDALEDGLLVESAEVTSDGTITVRVHNTTAGAIDAASHNLTWLVINSAA